LILGRGSSIDSFPLFGYNLADYEQLFEEKTGLFAELLKGWTGHLARPDPPPAAQPRHRPAHRVRAVPNLDRRRRQSRVGRPRSALRVSLMLAIIGGNPARFAPSPRLFREAIHQLGQPARPVGVHAPGHVAATDEQAVEEFWPRRLETIRRLSRERRFAVPTKDSFMHDLGPSGALYVGSPAAVTQKIVATSKLSTRPAST
jgi:hypothetical protein